MDEQGVEAGQGFFATLDGLFAEWVVAPIRAVFMFDLAFWDNGAPGEIELPLVVVWLALGALFFTLRFQFVNLRAFRHALDCVRGRYSRPDDPGEITHFQALSAALSATVGLGNIAGVAFAVAMGGPGAVFWMVLAGILGMSSKFAECTLGQKYRIVRADGHVSGGPMHYLRTGLAEIGLGRLGRVLAVVFAVMCIGGSFGGGNMFQSNQSYAQVAHVLPFLQGWLGAAGFGVVLCFFVGLVIIGGIKRIGEVAGILVPVMCIVYVACGLLILAVNAAELGSAFATIVREAFSPGAVAGGFVGVLVQGFRRAAFSQRGRHRLGPHRPLGRQHRRAGARGHRRPARALHRHAHRLHHDRPGDRGDALLRRRAIPTRRASTSPRTPSRRSSPGSPRCSPSPPCSSPSAP